MPNTIKYSIYEQHHHHHQSTYGDTRPNFGDSGEFDSTTSTTVVGNIVNGAGHSTATNGPLMDSQHQLLQPMQQQQQQPPPLPPPPSSASVGNNNNNQQPPIPPPLPHQSSLMMMNGSAQSHTLGSLSDQMSLISVGNHSNTLSMSQILSQQRPSGDSNDIRWRDPDLHEVIEFLSHSNPVVKANAAAYLQHLCFMDDSMKQKARTLGSIPALVNLLNHEILLLTGGAAQQQPSVSQQPTREVQRNALGALRNLSYGRHNDENKRAIKEANGVTTLISLMKLCIQDQDIKELITGVLWNLSSSEELKKNIIDSAVKDIVNFIIIPGSGWDGRVGMATGLSGGGLAGFDHVYGTNVQGEIYWSTVFRNATGVLRNVSSAGEYARRKLRECDGLCESLLFIVRQAIAKNDIDNKSIENCVCVLRNLSYRCQEVIDVDYDKHHTENQILSPSSSKAGSLIGSVGKVGDNFGCFGVSRKKKDSKSNLSSNTSLAGAGASSLSSVANGSPTQPNGSSTDPKASMPSNAGMQLLWQPEVVQVYLSLLSDCSNPETLEAAAGAIQNLCACYWPISAEIRAAVRKEKGLPVLVELLRMEVDRVVCAVATALRNLALDNRNKELIGKYAMRDLVSKLPSPSNVNLASMGTSDDTIAAVLATLNEVISKNADFAKSLLEADGMERLLHIAKHPNKHSGRVLKFTSQLLCNMWAHVDLRETYRKAGYKEAHFLLRNTAVAGTNSTGGLPSKGSSNSVLANCSANNTLSRPMCTQSGTKYEDNGPPRQATRATAAGRPIELRGLHSPLPNPNTGNYGVVGMLGMPGRSEEMPLNEMGQFSEGVMSPNQPLMQQPNQQMAGGMPIYQSNMASDRYPMQPMQRWASNY